MTGNKGPFSRCIIIIKGEVTRYSTGGVDSLSFSLRLVVHLHLLGSAWVETRGAGTRAREHTYAHGEPGSFLQWNGGRSTMNGGHLFAFSIVRLHRGPGIVRARGPRLYEEGKVYDPTKNLGHLRHDTGRR